MEPTNSEYGLDLISPFSIQEDVSRVQLNKSVGSNNPNIPNKKFETVYKF